MFESILKTTETSISAGPAVLIMVEAFVLGVLIAACYMFTQKKLYYSKEYVITVSILPAIVSLIIILVGSSIARALSLAGAFALVRFRSAQGTAKEIVFLFFAMGIGLAQGLGFVVFAPIATLIICLCLVIVCKTPFGEKVCQEKLLKVTVSQDLDYNKEFSDLFKEYTSEYTLKQIKTTDKGNAYELSYYVIMKNGIDEKNFIESIRKRNCGLNISLGMLPDKNDIVL